MKKVLVYSGAVIALTIVGFVLYPNFMNLSFLFLNKGDVSIFSSSMSGRFSAQLFFAISIGVIPLFYLWVRYFANPKHLRQKILTYLLIIAGGILSWQCSIILLNYRLKRISELNIKPGIQNSISLEYLNFDAYLFIGYAVGTILSIFIFRNKNVQADNA